METNHSKKSFESNKKLQVLQIYKTILKLEENKRKRIIIWKKAFIKLKMLNLSKEIYHCCDFGYTDRTRAQLTRQGSCSNPTRDPFWKESADVSSGVKTRNQLKYYPIASRCQMEFYFDQKKEQQETSKATENTKVPEEKDE